MITPVVRLVGPILLFKTNVRSLGCLRLPNSFRFDPQTAMKSKPSVALHSSATSDWEPQVVKISKIVPHPDASVLDIVTVLKDYPVVIKRNEYKENDLACYIPIDTVVPDTENFHFLSPIQTEEYLDNGEKKTRQLGPKYAVGNVPEKYRVIKAKKIRGVYSQGLLVPCTADMKESDSVVEILGLKKWEEEEEENLPRKRKVTSGIGGCGPSPKGWDVPHYDIHPIRKYIDCLTNGEEIVLTEKLHGSNGAFVHDGSQLWVKSRNHYRRMNPADMWWDIARRYDLENKLKQKPYKVFFGEVYGLMKRFRYDCQMGRDRILGRVRFFDVWDVHTKQFLDFDVRQQIIAECGLDAVPVLYRGPWLGKDEMYPLAEGPSTLGGRNVREGWVLNTIQERYEPLLKSRMQVKRVGEGYNLQK